ncbi:TonB-dependent receptor [Oleiagrimonas sp. C23AA]|uniref:TonB-dependent receptor n=1 Tax=Oleiagrimonas sp. C23AA TaxID=2719047 RepID=UPI00141E9203|nr:TonB-dependent receptor [Oleiagrimonas sp. C23AA]NII11212.1 TonB-dependent receptor [Oleiagrimonas sp. C23AA]
MNKTAYLPRRRLIASAVMIALAGTVSAQTTSNAQDNAAKRAANAARPTPGNASSTQQSDQPATLETVKVTGILGSLESSMNLKRYSDGVVDGIVAEDIGKFPDTNLAEALQRISGVSIDRVNGEGSRVTVRGVGPDFNLVLLNGRQMPTANIADTSASNSRAFDFANLAAEAIAEIDVYKTARASTPAGGIGATINVKTARPLDNPGSHGSFGVKGVWDSSNKDIPDSLQNTQLTPEISGIYSTTSADGRFGVAVSGSYQVRDYGVSQVKVDSGWHTFHGDEVNWGTIPQPGQPGSERITNRPGPNDVYSVPQNLNYSVSGIRRERTNGQVVFQYKPIDDITTTLDYTYAENKVQAQRNEMSVWFNYGPSSSSWTDGPVAAPLVYSEIIDPANSDLAMGGGKSATKNTLKSLGFNTAWKVNNSLNLGLDVHHSVAEAGSDSPYGSNSVLGTAGFFRGTTTADFGGSFPVLNVQLPDGMTQIDPSKMLVTGSSFRNSYMRSKINQIQLTGDFTFADYSRLDFGVDSTDVHNRSAFSNVQLDTWGGATSPDDYPDSVWHLDHMGHYFDAFPRHNDPNFTDAFFTWNFDQVRQLAEDAWVAAGHDASDYRASPDFTTDRRVHEKSMSAYLQWSQTYDFQMPLHVAVGVRYEKTDVTSRALVPTATGISWGSQNELSLLQGEAGFTQLSGSYKYVLPDIDLSLDLTDSMKLRASYGETIGRPGWGDIQGGQTLNTLVRVDGGTGSQGNPGLKPLLSHNIDLSFEWYYGKGSYMSVAFFRKNIDNYVGTSQVTEQPFQLHTPIGGDYWNAAISNGCADSDTTCIRNYIFTNFAGSPGVNPTGTDTNGNITGTIVGQPGDPIANFRITTPANQQSASLHGWEFNVQQMLWDTGFGVSANYTLVDSGLTYDNYVIGQQFALEGLSDSANFVAFYDKGPWQARAAYNWRGKFLASRFDGTGPNPIYTAPYGQWDVSMSYDFTKRFSMSLEGINITNRVQRQYSRNIHQLEYATQTGARYMLGLRYKF